MLKILIFLGFSMFFASCNYDASSSTLVKLTDDKKISLIKFPNAQNIEIKHKFEFLEDDYSNGIHSFTRDLGMQSVPVLDQGSKGTCVTFASTAALDALIAKSDFVSQQCSLELDKYLGQDYWNGAYYPSQIVDPIKKYGVVAHAKCPHQYPSSLYKMAPTKYTALADKDKSVKVKDVQILYSVDPTVGDVRAAINRGHRVLFGFVIDSSQSVAIRGFDLTVDGKAYKGGLWACKQGDIDVCKRYDAGHEVLIVGYDDDQQLLKIRNSWGVSVGENGDYYMSYKFFEDRSLDMTEIWL
jgi:C1A family cysteine protease